MNYTSEGTPNRTTPEVQNLSNLTLLDTRPQLKQEQIVYLCNKRTETDEVSKKWWCQDES